MPGLPHRTGHGIGLDGHEWTNFVRGNKTPIQPGMCFSDEPTIAIYGEFGVRLEDCLHITEAARCFFTKQSESLEHPVSKGRGSRERQLRRDHNRNGGRAEARPQHVAADGAASDSVDTRRQVPLGQSGGPAFMPTGRGFSPPFLAIDVVCATDVGVISRAP